MSIHLPESNAQSAGNTSNGVALGFPAGASFKPASRGFTVGIWVEIPAAGYENNVNYNVLTRGTGGTSGNDGYVRFNQATSQISTNFRSGGTQLLTATTLTKASGNWKGKKILIMLIQTAANAHLVVCEPGQSPEYTTAASTGIYTTSLAPRIAGRGSGRATHLHSVITARSRKHSLSLASFPKLQTSLIRPSLRLSRQERKASTRCIPVWRTAPKNGATACFSKTR